MTPNSHYAINLSVMTIGGASLMASRTNGGLDKGAHCDRLIASM